MLQIQSLNMHHTRNHQQLIEEANFVINPGDRVALIGAEGTGKSSLLRWIYNPSLTPEYINITGQMKNDFGKMAYLPQVMDAETLQSTIDDYLFNPDDAATTDFNLLFQAAQTLDFDVNTLDGGLKMSQLSGGQQIKLQLVKLMASDPDFYLLYEPSNNLDFATQKWLIHFIKTTPATFLYVSHDEHLLQETATKVIHLEQVHHKTKPRFTTKQANYQAYVDERRERFTKDTQIANKQVQEYKGLKKKNNEIQQSVDHQLEITKDVSVGRMLAKKMKNLKSQEKRFDREKGNFTEKPLADDLINIEFNRTKPLDNKLLLSLYQYELNEPVPHLIQNIHFNFHSHDKVGFYGENGVGKTSLLAVLYNMLSQREDIQLGYMPQNYQDQFDMEQTAIDFLTVVGDKEEHTLIMTVLGSSLFTVEEMQQPIKRLSGGQQAKLFLLKMSMEGSNVILLDEPTRNFSPLSQGELRTMFQEFTGGIIAISHDLLFMEAVCDKIYEVTSNGLLEHKNNQFSN